MGSKSEGETNPKRKREDINKMRENVDESMGVCNECALTMHK